MSIRKPIKHNYDKINEFRRLYPKHRSLQRQIEQISFASMGQLSKQEFIETKEIFTQLKLQSIAISDKLTLLLTRFYNENSIINAKYKVINT